MTISDITTNGCLPQTVGWSYGREVSVEEDTDQSDRQTETKTEPRRGTGSEKEIMRERTPETRELVRDHERDIDRSQSFPTKIHIGNVTVTETESTHYHRGPVSNTILS